MPQLSTKSLRRDDLPRGSALDIETLLVIAERLSGGHKERDIAQLLSDQAHESFFPASAAVLVKQKNGLEVAGLTASDERLDRALKNDSRATEAVMSAVSEALQNGNAGFHRIEIQDEAGPGLFQGIYCAPLRSASSNAALALFLTADQRLGEGERTFFAALAEVGAMALSNLELRRTANLKSEELQELLD